MFDKADTTAPLNRHALHGSYSPPALAAPAGPAGSAGSAWGSPDMTWVEEPIRQSTAGSTVASESDARWLPPPELAAGHEERDRRLAGIKELRGWKHYLLHVAGVPLAFAAGLSLGAASAAAAIFSFRLDASGPAGMPPALLNASRAPYAPALPPTAVPVAYMESPPLDNSCLIRSLVLPDGPQTFDACGFVVRSTDAVWNLRGDVDAAIDKYFHEGYVDAGSWGRRIIGKKALRDAVLSEMRAFPDIQIHITDCVCKGNDNDGYKCAMPDVLTGTNLGPSAYGPATGRFARWTGMVESLVKRNPATGQWQYYAEWGVHDEWALIQQLGLDFSRVPHPQRNTEPVHNCAPLLNATPQLVMNSFDADAQRAFRAAKANA